MFLCFSFHLTKQEVINLLVGNNKKFKLKEFIFNLWYHHNALQKNLLLLLPKQQLLLIKNQMNNNIIAVSWSYQKSKSAWNSSWRKTKLWLLYQHIKKKKLGKNITLLQEFAITWILIKDVVNLKLL